MKQNELQSPIFTPQEYRSKLSATIAYLESIGINYVDVVFGFAWGLTIFPGDWESQKLNIKDIPVKILEYENDEHGKFGDDEIEIFIAEHNVSILFCHEYDIHLKFIEEDEMVRDLKSIFNITNEAAHALNNTTKSQQQDT